MPGSFELFLANPESKNPDSVAIGAVMNVLLPACGSLKDSESKFVVLRPKRGTLDHVGSASLAQW
jgi:hypothetical protein